MLSVFYCILSISWNTISCCSSLSLDQRSKSFLCGAVSETGSSALENSWDRVMPRVSQIFSRDVILGTAPLLYQEEMVDWGTPERSAS